MNKQSLLLAMILLLSSAFAVTTFMSTVQTFQSTVSGSETQEEGSIEVYTEEGTTVVLFYDSAGELYKATYSEVDKVDEDMNTISVVKQFSGVVLPRAVVNDYYIGYDWFTGTLQVIDLSTDTYVGNVSIGFIPNKVIPVYGNKVAISSFGQYYGGPKVIIFDPATLTIVAEVPDMPSNFKMFAENDTIAILFNDKTVPSLNLTVYKWDGSTLTHVADYGYTQSDLSFLTTYDWYEDFGIVNVWSKFYGRMVNKIIRLIEKDTDRWYATVFSINVTDGSIVNYTRTKLGYPYTEGLFIIKTVYDSGTGHIYDFLMKRFSSVIGVFVWNSSGYLINHYAKNTIVSPVVSAVVYRLDPIIAVNDTATALLIQRETTDSQNPEKAIMEGEYGVYLIQVNASDIKFMKVGTVTAPLGPDIYPVTYMYTAYSDGTNETIFYPIIASKIVGNGPNAINRVTTVLKIVIDSPVSSGSYVGMFHENGEGLTQSTNGTISTDVSGDFDDYRYYIQSLNGQTVETYPNPSYNREIMANVSYDTMKFYVLWTNPHLDCLPPYKVFEVTQIDQDTSVSGTIHDGYWAGREFTVYIPYTYMPAGHGNYIAYLCEAGFCQVEDGFTISRYGTLATTIEKPEDTVYSPEMPAQVNIKVRPLDNQEGCAVIPYTYDIYINSSKIGTINESNPEIVTYLDEGVYELFADYLNMPSLYKQDTGNNTKIFSVVRLETGPGAGGVVLTPPCTKCRAHVKITFYIKGMKWGKRATEKIRGALIEITVEKDGRVIFHKIVNTTKPLPVELPQPGRYKVKVKVNGKEVLHIDKYWVGEQNVEIPVPTEVTKTAGGRPAPSTRVQLTKEQKAGIMVIVISILVWILGLI